MSICSFVQSVDVQILVLYKGYFYIKGHFIRITVFFLTYDFSLFGIGHESLQKVFAKDRTSLKVHRM